MSGRGKHRAWEWEKKSVGFGTTPKTDIRKMAFLSFDKQHIHMIQGTWCATRACKPNRLLCEIHIACICFICVCHQHKCICLFLSLSLLHLVRKWKTNRQVFPFFFRKLFAFCMLWQKSKTTKMMRAQEFLWKFCPNQKPLTGCI